MPYPADNCSRIAYRWALVALVAAYLLTRLPFLTRLPVFVDEGAHIYWAQHELAGGWQAGKLLSILLMAGTLRLVPFDPLLVTRLGSVGLNLGVLFLIIDIGARLGTRREGLLAGLVYVLMPFTFFYTRLALVDHSMILLGFLTLRLSLAVERPYSPRCAGLLALVLIASMLAKMSGALFAFVPVLVVICMVPGRDWRRWVPPMVVIYVTAGAAFVGLILRDFGTEHGGKLASGPLLNMIANNTRVILESLVGLLTPPLVVLVMIAIGWALLKRRREDWLLLALIGLTIVPYIVVASVVFPRYVLPAMVPLAILAGRLLSDVLKWLVTRVPDRRRQVLVGAVVAVLFAAWPLTLMARLAVDPASAPLPELVRWQYVTGWPSGYGVDEMATFLKDEAAAEPGGVLAVRFPFLSQGYLGLRLYVSTADAVILSELNPTLPDLVAVLRRLGDQQRTLLVLSPTVEDDYFNALGQSLSDLTEAATLIWEYPKPDGESSLQIWEFHGNHLDDE